MTIVRMAVGLLFGVSLIVGGLVMEGSHVLSFVQVTSFVLVVGGCCGVLLMAFPLRTHAASYRAALGSGSIAGSDAAVARAYFEFFGRASVALGVVGTVGGLIVVMENLDQPERIGPGIAVAFCSFLYGLGVRVFWAGALGDAVAERATSVLQAERTVTLPEVAVPAVATTDEVAALRAKVGELTMELDRVRSRRAA